MSALASASANLFRQLVFVFVLALWLPHAIAADGAAIYAAQCASCHGAQALGNAAVFSPRLAGQNAAYLREQLNAYQQGQRGSHADDTQGQVMRTLARDLSAEQVAAVSIYLAALPDSYPGSERRSDPSTKKIVGASLYASDCAICHGQYGQGAESIFVPNLRILSSWYLDAQLLAYANGWRGGDGASTRAKNMRSMSGQVPDRDQRAAIVEHLTGPQSQGR